MVRHGIRTLKSMVGQEAQRVLYKHTVRPPQRVLYTVFSFAPRRKTDS